MVMNYDTLSHKHVFEDSNAAILSTKAVSLRGKEKDLLWNKQVSNKYIKLLTDIYLTFKP